MPGAVSMRSLTPDDVRLWERRQGIHRQIARTRGRRSRSGFYHDLDHLASARRYPRPHIRYWRRPMSADAFTACFHGGIQEIARKKTQFCPDCARIAPQFNPCNRIAKQGLFPRRIAPYLSAFCVSVFLCADDFGTQTRAPWRKCAGRLSMTPPNAGRRSRTPGADVENVENVELM